MIPNAVDARRLPLRRRARRGAATTLGLDGATVIGFAGSFYGYEGLDLLLDAAAALVPRHPNLRAAAGRRRPAGGSLKSAGAGGWASQDASSSPAACRMPRCSATTT